MTHLYTGQLDEMSHDTLLETLHAAQKCGLTKIQTEILRALNDRSLRIRDVCIMSQKARDLKLQNVIDFFRLTLERSPNQTLRLENFRHLSLEVVCETLRPDSFCADEIDILTAIHGWCKQQQPSDEDKEKLLALIRLPLVPAEELSGSVRETGLFSDHRLSQAEHIQHWMIRDAEFRAAVVRGDGSVSRPELHESIGSDPIVYRWRPWTRTDIELNEVSIVNHLKFELMHRVESSYCVEVSKDLNKWIRVVDYSDYPCRSLQDVYFEPQMVRYIRGVVSNCPEDVRFELANFQVSYSRRRPKHHRGIRIAEENVARAELGARVDRCFGEQNYLLMTATAGKVEHLKWARHKIGSGPIVIQLPQPYIVGSMRFLLKDSEAYSYHADTSVDRYEWDRVADYTSEFRSSWQVIHFEPRPVIFIRIKGTASLTMTEVCFVLTRYVDPVPGDNS